MSFVWTMIFGSVRKMEFTSSTNGRIPSGIFRQMREELMDSSDAIVDKIYRDREGGTWICTQFGGASYLPVRTLDFSIYLPDGKPGSVSGRRISELGEGKDGTIWVSTQDGGVCYWNPETRLFTTIPESADRQNVLSLFTSDDLIGAGYFKGGIDLITPAVSALSGNIAFKGRVQTMRPEQMRYQRRNRLRLAS